jgi:hypothetical protein
MIDKVNRTLTTTLTAILVVLFGLAGTAHAVAPAGSKIVGTAAVTGTGSTAEGELGDAVTTPVDPAAAITVELVKAAPYLSGPETSGAIENGPIEFLSYTIVAQANGEDTYNLSLVDPVTADFSGIAESALTAEFFVEEGSPAITEVTLGATAASDASSGDTVTTPSDGTAGDDSINGIAADDNVVIGGVVYSVVSASDDGTTGTITLDGSVDVTAGTLISEVKHFWMQTTDLGENTGDPAGEVRLTVTALAADSDLSASVESIVTVYHREDASTKQFVRIVDDTRDLADVYSDSDIYTRSDGTVYVNADDLSMDDAVSADPAVELNTLEYIIVAEAGTDGTLTAVTFEATIPAFTSYVSGSTYLNADSVPDVGGSSALEAGMAACDPITTLAMGCDAGLIVMAATAEATFQVTIDATEEFDAPSSGLSAWVTGDACYDGTKWAGGSCLWSEVEALGGQSYCNARHALDGYTVGSESGVTTGLLSCL